MSYQYKHLELALARTFKVDAEDMPAFRARIRHLRNLGVPTSQRPGSGRQIVYERSDAIRLLIALELELLGFSAKQAADASKSGMSSFVPKAEAAASKGQSFFLRIELSFALQKNPSMGWSDTPSKASQPADSHAHRPAAINIGASINLFDYHLKQLADRG